MDFGNLAQRPDLRPLFGSLRPQENEALLDRLLAVDSELVKLAAHASEHVGVPYETYRLTLCMRPDGTSAGIYGGPTGNAGDIWFDIDPAGEHVGGWPVGPPWVVVSCLVVFCSDSPEPGDEANTHELLRLEASANTPAGVLDILESHVAAMRAEISRHPRERYTMTPHAQLP
jgi:hypothetical protein